MKFQYFEISKIIHWIIIWLGDNRNFRPEIIFFTQYIMCWTRRYELNARSVILMVSEQISHLLIRRKHWILVKFLSVHERMVIKYMWSDAEHYTSDVMNIPFSPKVVACHSQYFPIFLFLYNYRISKIWKGSSSDIANKNREILKGQCFNF